MIWQQTGDILWDSINDFTEYYAKLEGGSITMDECLRLTQDAAMRRLR